MAPQHQPLSATRRKASSTSAPIICALPVAGCAALIIDSGAAAVNRTDPGKAGTLDAWSLAREMAPTLREHAVFIKTAWYFRSSPDDEKYKRDQSGHQVILQIQDHPYRDHAHPSPADNLLRPSASASSADAPSLRLSMCGDGGCPPAPPAFIIVRSCSLSHSPHAQALTAP